MTVADLKLEGQAHAGALALKAKFPEVVFTSGRREAPDQARAMAQNIARNRKWIGQTYSVNPQSRQLQQWVDAHPQLNAPTEIAAGLLKIMEGWTTAQKATLSRHFSGQAFDVQPVPGPKGEAIKAYIRTLPGLHKFLEREGGLVRWHAQFV